jgi:hypothetical protein
MPHEKLHSLLQLLDIGVRKDDIVRDNQTAVARDSHYAAMFRADSETLLVNDHHYGVGREGGCWSGDSKALLEIAWHTLGLLRISRSEVIRTKVYSEWHQGADARRDTSGRLRGDQVLELTPVERGRVWTRFFRTVEGIPVWSSSFTLGLTARGKIGFLLLHWPKLPEEALKRAADLAKLVKDGFSPQNSKDVEKIRAVLLHSPAIGTCLEFVSCIRVEYKSAPGVGKLPVAYVSEGGTAIRVPTGLPELKTEVPLTRRNQG